MIIVNCQTCTSVSPLQRAIDTVWSFVFDADGLFTVFCRACIDRYGLPPGAIVYCVGCIHDGWGFNRMPAQNDNPRTRQWDNICLDCEVELVR
jgi:hypothetical protein